MRLALAVILLKSLRLLNELANIHMNAKQLLKETLKNYNSEVQHLIDEFLQEGLMFVDKMGMVHAPSLVKGHVVNANSFIPRNEADLIRFAKLCSVASDTEVSKMMTEQLILTEDQLKFTVNLNRDEI